MRTVERIISAHAPEILEAWAEKAEQAAGARGLSRPELMSIMPAYLRTLARAAGEDGSAEQAALIESHVSSRLRAGFNLHEVLDELAFLARTVARTWHRQSPDQRPDEEDLDRLFADLHAAIAIVTRAFGQHLQEDEQTEKRYLRLLHDPFLDPQDAEAPLSPRRLRMALDIVREAAGAAAAALLLHDRSTGELFMTAAAGFEEEPFNATVRSLAGHSVAGEAASPAHPAWMGEVEIAPLDVPDGLRRSGIHSLLGVRLPPQRTLLGALYLGLREARPLGAREARRIKAIAAQLALHLDNAKLYADLIEQLETLKIERRLRSQSVTIRAHDLRGPLSAARLAASLLARPRPDDPDVARHAGVVLRNLDRADRMVTDLLDAERIRAGHRPALALEETDLAAIAREVVNELDPEHPGRFVLRGGRELRGVWDPAELRRALWNLISNALKHGAGDAPVTVTVAERAGGAEVSVHNEGAPISPEVQATLFKPFVRAPSAGGAKGWGLGLALVYGCAEAHGGSVDVDSAEGRGTTFTLRLPLDSRPAQAGAA
ncbi:MAG: HAMP domain-containing histidine kinase [Polyangiaceae bacterium]|nr:HAMP domain-containing histidine kinase [Polyangiaceae bacterium]